MRIGGSYVFGFNLGQQARLSGFDQLDLLSFGFFQIFDFFIKPENAFRSLLRFDMQTATLIFTLTNALFGFGDLPGRFLLGNLQSLNRCIQFTLLVLSFTRRDFSLITQIL